VDQTHDKDSNSSASQTATQQSLSSLLLTLHNIDLEDNLDLKNQSQTVINQKFKMIGNLMFWAQDDGELKSVEGAIRIKK
jgi:hypothetical protein